MIPYYHRALREDAQTLTQHRTYNDERASTMVGMPKDLLRLTFSSFGTGRDLQNLWGLVCTTEAYKHLLQHAVIICYELWSGVSLVSMVSLPHGIASYETNSYRLPSSRTLHYGLFPPEEPLIGSYRTTSQRTTSSGILSSGHPPTRYSPMV